MPDDTGPFPAPPLWERRFVAASVDATLMALCCAGLFHSYGLLSYGQHPRVAWPSAIVLGLMFAVEALTGVTPGKLMTRLDAARDPRRSDAGVAPHCPRHDQVHSGCRLHREPRVRQPVAPARRGDA